MPIMGGDYLAGRCYQAAMIKAHKRGDCAGIFLRTFGDARKTVRKMAASLKFSEIVVQLAPFDNSHKYPISKLRKQLMKDAAWLEETAKKFSHTIFLLCPFTEHNHPRSVMQPLFMDLQQIAPSCIMVNSIWKGQTVPGVITELHIEDSKHLPIKPSGEYIISFDGCGGKGQGNFPDLDIPSIIEKYHDARQIRAWNFEYNGKYGWKDPSSIENRENFPSVDYIKAVQSNLRMREGSVTWDNKALYKCMADDHDGPQPKDNRALAILPIQLPEVKVFDKAGNVIDVMKRFPGDHEGKPKGARYYSNKYAFQIADKAVANTGSSLIRIHQQPLTCGYLRSGLFR